MFGIIAQKLKRIELPSFEILKEELSKILIQSKNLTVTELSHTSDFKKFIENGHLLKMEGFRTFAQFIIRKENKRTGLYLKYDELDDNFQFPNAISLLQNLPDSIRLTTSPFRQETAYSEIFDSVWKKYIPSLSPKFSDENISEIKTNWETRIKMLIDLKESNFEPFDFQQLNAQSPPVNVPLGSLDLLPGLSSSRAVAVTATFYPVDMSRLSALDLQRDTSLVFYSETKRWRPWTGLFVELSDDGASVTVQWVKKEKQKFILHLNRDGSPYLSSVPVQSIMFADVLENLSPENIRDGPYKMQSFVKSEIDKAYEERDRNLENN